MRSNFVFRLQYMNEVQSHHSMPVGRRGLVDFLDRRRDCRELERGPARR